MIDEYQPSLDLYPYKEYEQYEQKLAYEQQLAEYVQQLAEAKKAAKAVISSTQYNYGFTGFESTAPVPVQTVPKLKEPVELEIIGEPKKRLINIEKDES
jgi:hypothetical protein